MKYIKYITVPLLVLLLTACAESVNVEDVYDDMKEQAKEVESYQTEAEISNETTLIDSDSDGLKEHQHMDMVINEATDEFSGTQIEQSGGFPESHLEVYTLTDVSYLNHNEDGWRKYGTDEVRTEEGVSITYAIVMDAIDKLIDDMEAKEEKEDYVLTFNGSNETLLQGLKEPYAPGANGMRIKDLDLNLFVYVDKTSHQIKLIEFTLDGESGNRKTKVEVNHSFEQFNEFDTIEVPEDVFEEAE